MRSASVLGGVALAAMLAAGCGGSVHRSKAQQAFTAKADAQCRAVSAERARLGLVNRTQASTPAARAKDLQRRYRLDQEQVRRLRSLTPPAQRPGYQRLVGVYAQQVAAISRSISDTRRSNAASLARDQRTVAVLGARYSRDAKVFGLTVCGQHHHH